MTIDDHPAAACTLKRARIAWHTQRLLGKPPGRDHIRLALKGHTPTLERKKPEGEVDDRSSSAQDRGCVRKVADAQDERIGVDESVERRDGQRIEMYVHVCCAKLRVNLLGVTCRRTRSC